MGVTIVANEFSEETRKNFQKEADELAKQNYSAHAIMEHLAHKRHVATSMTYSNGHACVHCHSVRR